MVMKFVLLRSVFQAGSSSEICTKLTIRNSVIIMMEILMENSDVSLTVFQQNKGGV